MNQLLNIGIGSNFWISVIKIVVLLPFIYQFVKYAIRTIKIVDRAESPQDEKKFRRNLKRAIIFLVLTIFMALILFMAFGSGKPVVRIPAEEDGMRELVDQAPAEDLKKARTESDKKIPEVLKRQADPGFKQEADEADAYLKKALKGTK